MAAARERLDGSAMSTSRAECVRRTALSAARLAADGENRPLRHPMPDTTGGCSRRRGRGSGGCWCCLLCADEGDGDLARPFPALPPPLGLLSLSPGAVLPFLPGASAATLFSAGSGSTPGFCTFAFAADSTDALSLHASDGNDSSSASGCSCCLRLTGSGGCRGAGASDSTTSLTSSSCSSATGGSAWALSLSFSATGSGAATLPLAPAAFLLTQLPMPTAGGGRMRWRAGRLDQRSVESNCSCICVCVGMR